MKKNYIVILILSILSLTACNHLDPQINDKEHDTRKIDNEFVKESYENFDRISDLVEFDEDKFFVFGSKAFKPMAGVFDLKENKYTKVSKDILYPQTGIYLINDGFYTYNDREVYIYNNDLTLNRKIKIPNEGSVPFRNPVCVSEDGKRMYYNVAHSDFSISIMELVMDDDQTSEVCQYCTQPEGLTMLEEMIVKDDEKTIYYFGQTIVDIKKQSIDSYGTIDLQTGEIQDNPLDKIQIEKGKHVVAITDLESRNQEPKNYMLIGENKGYRKLSVKGTQHVKLVNQNIILTHDIELNPKNNVYETYQTYVYDGSGKLIDSVDSSNRFIYHDEIVDYYNEKYKLFIQCKTPDEGNMEIEVLQMD